ncbi:uncharacterized protein LOC132903339 [Amyelois transitella]|uniref:uncharacterized protein LOC132903339 n=1 Tax=Amyelois transitella TaxID=680683 RepID=UPI0029906124|nr:uncharacterized protein LOC132903339 [Amyelois transitella]
MVRNILRSRRTEILLDNFIDEDFQNMLLPLNIMQTVYFNRKFRIINNFITSNQTVQKTTSVIGGIICTVMFIVRFYFRYKVDMSFIFNFFNLFFNVIGFSINCVCAIVHCNSNVELILILYKIYTLQTNKIKLRNFKIWNWIYCVYLLISYIFVASLFFFLNVNIYICLLNCLCSFIAFCHDFNMVYAIRLLELLSLELEIWTKELTIETVKTANESNENEHCSRMFEIYINIQEAIMIHNRIYQTQVRIIMFASMFTLIYTNNIKLKRHL